MSKLVKQKLSTGFTQIPNIFLRETKLSFKAKGLWAYLWSKPEKWDFAVNRIQKESKDGRDSVIAGIKELEEAGYLERKRLQTGRMEYHIYFEATYGKSHSGKIPLTENPYSKKEIIPSNKEIEVIQREESQLSENSSNIKKEMNLKNENKETKKQIEEKKKKNSAKKRKKDLIEKFEEFYDHYPKTDFAKLKFAENAFAELADEEIEEVIEFVQDERELEKFTKSVSEINFLPSAESFIKNKRWKKQKPINHRISREQKKQIAKQTDKYFEKLFNN